MVYVLLDSTVSVLKYVKPKLIDKVSKILIFVLSK